MFHNKSLKVSQLKSKSIPIKVLKYPTLTQKYNLKFIVIHKRLVNLKHEMKHYIFPRKFSRKLKNNRFI